MKKIFSLLLLVIFSLFALGCDGESQSIAQNFSVTFDSLGGSAVQSQIVESGGVAQKPDDPTKEGFIFDGW